MKKTRKMHNNDENYSQIRTDRSDAVGGNRQLINDDESGTTDGIAMLPEYAI